MLAVRKVVPVEVGRICLQVHDEILIKRGPEFDEDWLAIVKDVCENGCGYVLDVPLVFECKLAESWAEKS